MRKKTQGDSRDWYKQEESAIVNGLSKWTAIVFKWKKNNEEFYRVERDLKEMKTKQDQFVTRREYFNGKLKRTYQGWENSFVEFVDLMDKQNTSPDKVEISFYPMHILIMKRERLLYSKYYLAFFGSQEAETAQKKKMTRKSMEAIRASLGEEELRRRSEAVERRLLALPEYAAAGSVMVYVSKRGEVCTHDLIRRALADGKRVAAPVAVTATRTLMLGPVDDFEADLVRGKYGVLEPTRTGVDVADIDLFVVPGTAFDRDGNRLGSGWGYFDKLLGDLPGDRTKVGLAFDFQVVEHLEPEDHDIPIDVVISETETSRESHNRRNI